MGRVGGLSTWGCLRWPSGGHNGSSSCFRPRRWENKFGCILWVSARSWHDSCIHSTYHDKRCRSIGTRYTRQDARCVVLPWSHLFVPHARKSWSWRLARTEAQRGFRPVGGNSECQQFSRCPWYPKKVIQQFGRVTDPFLKLTKQYGIVGRFWDVLLNNASRLLGTQELFF